MSTTSNGVRSQDITQVPDAGVAYFEGLACTWQTNSNNIRFRRGAFRKAIAEAESDRRERGSRVLWPVLANHLPEQACGFIAEAEERADGLWVKSFLDLITPWARKTYHAARKGYGDGLSLGFEARAEHRDGSVRVIDEGALYEISLGALPIDDMARITAVKSYEEVEALAFGAGHTASKERKMTSYGWIDEDDHDDFDTGVPRYQIVPAFRIEPGLDPMEDPKNFEKEIRKQLREEDDIYMLHGKAFDREVELRKRQREERQRLQREALEAERKAQAERQAAMSAPTFTSAQFALATGLDESWLRVRFQGWVSSGMVTAIDEKTLTLNAQDVKRMAQREHGRFEARFQEIAFRRGQERQAA